MKKLLLTILPTLLIACSSGSGNSNTSVPTTLSKPVMYIIERGTNGLVCDIVENGQSIANCTQLELTGIDMNNIVNISLSPTLNKAYLSDRENNTVYLCDIDITNNGQLIDCRRTGNPSNDSAFFRPASVTINVENNSAYIANDSLESASVAGCDVDSTTGQLYGCYINQGNNPGESQALNNSPTSVAINPITQDLFVSTFLGQPATCLAQFINVSGCETIELSGYKFWATTQVVISQNKQYAYFTNYGAGFVSICAIDQSSGNLTSCQDSIDIMPQYSFGVNSIALSTNGELAYVSNFDEGVISVCNIDSADGIFTSCTALPMQFIKPSSIAIYQR